MSTQAQRISAFYDDDGQRFFSRRRRIYLPDLCERVVGVYGSHNDTARDATRYDFDDSSSIVVAGDGCSTSCTE